MYVQKIAAFSQGHDGGNPAGVVITEEMLPEEEMRDIAAEIGFSETAFVSSADDAFRVRYFSPESEVPFCGHATIALGAALAKIFGGGVFPLRLNDATIKVEAHPSADLYAAVLHSPPTRSKPALDALVDEALALFGYRREDLDGRIPPAIIHGGADHLLIPLNSRQALAAMRYDLAAGRTLMLREGLVTIVFAWAQSQRAFHTRNAFASGGVYEDPATGAATAALAGYLREIGWAQDGSIDVIQGEDMGMPSRLSAEIPREPGSPIAVSGTARMM